MDEHKIISSDSHIVEPPGLWTERMTGKFKDRAPVLIKGENDDFYVDGKPIGATLGGLTAAGLRFEKPEDIRLEGKITGIIPGAYEPAPRLADMDQDGIHSDLIYPSVGLHMYSAVEDAGLTREIFAAYNDWLADFCGADPERLKGVAMLVLDDDIQAGIQELQRVAKNGLGGAMISVFPRPGESYDQPVYEPFWAAAEEVGLPISLHVGTNRPGSLPTPGKSQTNVTPSGATRANNEHWVRMTLCHIVFSGVCERYPKLMFIQLEHELGWLPFFMGRLDYVYRERKQLTPYRFKDGAVPTDFIRRNVYHSFQEDGLGVRDRDIIGVDNLCWGSDYPHAESTFPRSREILEEILNGVPEDERLKITALNAARLYNIN